MGSVICSLAPHFITDYHQHFLQYIDIGDKGQTSKPCKDATHRNATQHSNLTFLHGMPFLNLHLGNEGIYEGKIWALLTRAASVSMRAMRRDPRGLDLGTPFKSDSSTTHFMSVGEPDKTLPVLPSPTHCFILKKLSALTIQIISDI